MGTCTAVGWENASWRNVMDLGGKPRDFCRQTHDDGCPGRKLRFRRLFLGGLLLVRLPQGLRLRSAGAAGREDRAGRESCGGYGKRADRPCPLFAVGAVKVSGA